MEAYIDLLKLFLPELLVKHFDLTSINQEGEVLHLYFEEISKPDFGVLQAIAESPLKMSGTLFSAPQNKILRQKAGWQSPSTVHRMGESA